ncbi:MAG: hypothetical protein IPI00_12510 [Flavobacteriales bacterium]|nr:hypothetical protein [Flavobacteriales bacterium]
MTTPLAQFGLLVRGAIRFLDRTPRLESGRGRIVQDQSSNNKYDRRSFAV